MVGHRAVPGRRVQDRRVRPLQAQPQLLGQEGLRGRDRHAVLQHEDTMVQALKNGEIDYARGVPGAVQAARRATRRSRPSPASRTAGPSSASTPTGPGPARRSRAAARRQGPPGPGVPRRARLRDRQAEARRQRDRRLRDDRRRPRSRRSSQQDADPPSHWHTDPTNPGRSTSSSPSRSSTPPATCSTRGQQRLDKEGKPISLQLVMPDSTRTTPRSRQFIKDWFARARDQGQGRGRSRRTRSSTSCCRRRPATASIQGRLRHVHLDLVRRPGPERPAPGLPVRPDRGVVRQPVVQPRATTSCTSSRTWPRTTRSARRIIDQMQKMFYDQAPYHILYYDDELDAYRTDKFAGWQNQPLDTGVPLFTYSVIDYTFLTDATAATPAPSLDAPAARLVRRVRCRGAGATPTPAAPATRRRSSSNPTVARGRWRAGPHRRRGGRR